MFVRSIHGRLTALALALGLATAAPAAASPWSDLLGRLGTWFSGSVAAAISGAQHAGIDPGGRPSGHRLMSNEGVVVDQNGHERMSDEGVSVDPDGRQLMSDQGAGVDPDGAPHN